VNLIEEITKTRGNKLGKAVQIALNQVVGAYAIVVLTKSKNGWLPWVVRLRLVLVKESTAASRRLYRIHSNAVYLEDVGYNRLHNQ
jgi:hypothetical protein